MVFAWIGCVLSFICGIFEIYQWTSWSISVIKDAEIMGWQELLLASSCLLNGTVLLINFVNYMWQRRRPNEIEGSID